MYLERPEAVAAARGPPAQPELELETTSAQARDNEEEIPDAALYEFLQPAQVRSTDGINARTHRPIL